MIRTIQKEDIGQLLPLCEEHFAKVNMKERFYLFDKETAISTLKDFVSNPKYIGLVSIKEKEITGVCVFCIYSSIFDNEDIKASEILWYARNARDFLALFEEMERILGKDCSIHIGMPADAESVKQYLQKKGYINTEIIYSKGGNKNV
jgi:hypothetical protein